MNTITIGDQTMSPHDDFNSDVCRIRHENEDRRIAELEETIKKIYEKLDLFGQRPSWVTTTIITVLSSGLGICITALLRAK